MKFFKYQALSNDFAIADEDACEMGFSSLARILCERKKGAGADGLLIFARDKKSVRIFNADGSEADMCGNGLRCCALHALRTTGKFPDALVTAAGSIETRLICRSPFVCALNLGRPIFSDLPDGAGGEGCRAIALNTGAPHIVVADCGLACAESLWRRNKDSFNVDWVQIKKDGVLKIVTFERGVGRTAACGTGAACRFCRFEAGFGVFGLNRQGKRGGRRHGSVRGKRKHLDCGRSAFRLRRKFLRRRFLLKRRIYGKGNLHGFGHAV